MPNSQRITKRTSELQIGEYITLADQDVLLRVVGAPSPRMLTIRRLEGHYAGAVFSAGHQLGQRWAVIPSEEAKTRIAHHAEEMLMALLAAPSCKECSPCTSSGTRFTGA